MHSSTAYEGEQKQIKGMRVRFTSSEVWMTRAHQLTADQLAVSSEVGTDSSKYTAQSTRCLEGSVGSDLLGVATT